MAKSDFTDGLFTTLSNGEDTLQSFVEPVNGINKDVCGAKLLPTIVLAYPVE